MNTQSNAIPRALSPQGVAAAPVSSARVFYWSVRRELWENRSIYLAPAAVAGLVLVGFLIGATHLAKMPESASPNPMEQLERIMQPYRMAGLMIMAIEIIVALFYCLDALHGERRDRSVLFWKSLPVSDTTTVLSKASIPIVVLPVITFVVTLAVQWIMLLMHTAVLLVTGASAALLWSQVPWFQMSAMLLYHLVALHGLWFAPFYAWLILVSGWARRATFVWAALPLVAIGVVEKIAFNSSHFASMLQAYVLGGPGSNDLTAAGGPMMHPLTLVTIRDFLSSSSLWIALAMTGFLLGAAVQVRKYRGPI